MYRLGDSFLVSWRRLFVDRWFFPSTQAERSEYQIFRFGVAFLQFFSSDSFRVSSFTFLDALNLTHAERRNQVRFLFDGFVQLLCRNFDLHFVFFTSICLSFGFAVVSFFCFIGKELLAELRKDVGDSFPRGFNFFTFISHVLYQHSPLPGFDGSNGFDAFEWLKNLPLLPLVFPCAFFDPCADLTTFWLVFFVHVSSLLNE